jgi:hypothetical protein
MADIQISCPDCGNKRAVPEQLVGKKIKCKKCQAVFTVKAASAKTASAGAREAIPIKKEDEDDRSPYALREENLATRCPFCALPIEPPDAKICLNCGYDMLKRRRVDQKVVYERTFGDYLLWHLPTIGLTVLILTIIGVTAYLCIEVYPAQFEDAILPSGCFQVWTVIVALFVIYFSGKFVLKRLFKEFHPPEQVKRREDLEEE